MENLYPLLFITFSFLALYFLTTKKKYQHFLLITQSVFFIGSLNFGLTLYYFGSLLIVFAAHNIQNTSAYVQSSKKKLSIKYIATVMLITLYLIVKYSNFWNLVSPNNFMAPIGLFFALMSATSLLHFSMDNHHFFSKKNYYLEVLYTFYFPKSICGPVESPDQFLAQLSTYKKFPSPGQLVKGIMLLSVGAFKKLVLADYLMLHTNKLEHNITTLSYGGLYTLGLTYALTVYTDLSAYSDLATGYSALIGIRLTNNFNRIFFSTSVSNLFQRFHVSVGQWLLIHIYVPLRNLYKGKYSFFVATMGVWLFVSLLHELSTKYLTYGVSLGLLVLIDRYLDILAFRHKINGLIIVTRVLKFSLLLLVPVCVLFFAGYGAKSIFAARNLLPSQGWDIYRAIATFVIPTITIATLLFQDIFAHKLENEKKSLKCLLGFVFVSALLLVSTFFLSDENARSFIYQQF